MTTAVLNRPRPRRTFIPRCEVCGRTCEVQSKLIVDGADKQACLGCVADSRIAASREV